MGLPTVRRVAASSVIEVVFRCPYKLSRMIPTVKLSRTAPSCAVNHRNKFVPCVKNVVYYFPVSCGKKYIGRTSQCLNDRLRQHKSRVESRSDDVHQMLKDHLRACSRCHPAFRKTEVRWKYPSRPGQEIAETTVIHLSRGNVSQRSVNVSSIKVAFVARVLPD